MMAGFLDACFQAYKIILPLLDTIIPMNICPDETALIWKFQRSFFTVFSDFHESYGKLLYPQGRLRSRKDTKL